MDIGMINHKSKELGVKNVLNNVLHVYQILSVHHVKIIIHFIIKCVNHVKLVINVLVVMFQLKYVLNVFTVIDQLIKDVFKFPIYVEMDMLVLMNNVMMAIYLTKMVVHLNVK